MGNLFSYNLDLLHIDCSTDTARPSQENTPPEGDKAVDMASWGMTLAGQAHEFYRPGEPMTFATRTTQGQLVATTESIPDTSAPLWKARKLEATELHTIVKSGHQLPSNWYGGIRYNGRDISSNPEMARPISASWELPCAHCGQRTKLKFMCATCNLTYYCTKGCMNAHLPIHEARLLKPIEKENGTPKTGIPTKGMPMKGKATKGKK